MICFLQCWEIIWKWLAQGRVGKLPRNHSSVSSTALPSALELMCFWVRHRTNLFQRGQFPPLCVKFKSHLYLRIPKLFSLTVLEVLKNVTFIFQCINLIPSSLIWDALDTSIYFLGWGQCASLTHVCRRAASEVLHLRIWSLLIGTTKGKKESPKRN